MCEWARGFPGEVTGARRGQFLMGLSALFASRRNPPSSLFPYLCISIVRLFLSLSFSACSPDPPVSLSDVIRWLRLMSSCLCWRVRIVHGRERKEVSIWWYLEISVCIWSDTVLDSEQVSVSVKPLETFWTHVETLMSGWTTSFRNVASRQRFLDLRTGE